GHVIPALINKIHKAKTNGTKSITIWGTGTPKREFLFVDNLANACVYLMQNYNDSEIINIGAGEDITIKELAETICRVIDYKGKLEFDKTKPDGTPRKLLDVTKINKLGWKAKTSLEEGLRKTYDWYLKTKNVRS
ncbi:MAG: hypothetical protein FD167_6156, partial [bacterium]